MKRSRMRLLLFLLSMTLLLGGCWDKREVEQNDYVIALGIDQSEQKDMLEVTYLIENPQVGSSNISQSAQEPASELLTLTVPDWITMQDMSESMVAREVEFSHTRVVVVGEKMAKSGKLFPFLQGSMRGAQISHMAKLIVTREKASDFLQQNQPKMETRPHKYYDLMALRWQANGLLPLASFNDFLDKVTEDSPFLAIYATTESRPAPERGIDDSYLPGEIEQHHGNDAQFIGAAVFRKGKMVGSMTGEEVRLSRHLQKTSEAGEMLASFPDPLALEYRIAIRINQSQRTKIQMDLHRNPHRIRAAVPLDMELLSIPSQVDYVSDQKKQTKLKQFLEEQIEQKMQGLIKKTQEEFQGDPFLWALEARRHFWTWEAFEDDHWSEKYTQADIKVKVEVTFTGFGKEPAPQPFQRRAVKESEKEAQEE